MRRQGRGQRPADGPGSADGGASAPPFSLAPCVLGEQGNEFGFPAEAIPPLQDYIQRNLAATRRAAAAGVRLGMGSDAVYTMFGQNTRELGWFVKKQR